MNQIFILIVVTLIMSYGAGLVIGGHEKGRKLVQYELNQLIRFVRWILGHLLQGLGNLSHHLATKCKAKKKKTP